MGGQFIGCVGVLVCGVIAQRDRFGQFVQVDPSAIVCHGTQFSLQSLWDAATDSCADIWATGRIMSWVLRPQPKHTPFVNIFLYFLTKANSPSAAVF